MMMVRRPGPERRGVEIGTIKGSCLRETVSLGFAIEKIICKETKKRSVPPHMVTAYDLMLSSERNSSPKYWKKRATRRAKKASRKIIFFCVLKSNSFTKAKIVGELPMGLVTKKNVNAFWKSESIRIYHTVHLIN